MELNFLQLEQAATRGTDRRRAAQRGRPAGGAPAPPRGARRAHRALGDRGRRLTGPSERGRADGRLRLTVRPGSPSPGGTRSGVAQLAEHSAVNRRVAGSSPAPGASRPAAASASVFQAPAAPPVPRLARRRRAAAPKRRSRRPAPRTARSPSIRRAAHRSERRPPEPPGHHQARARPGHARAVLRHVADVRAAEDRDPRAERPRHRPVPAVADHQRGRGITWE